MTDWEHPKSLLGIEVLNSVLKKILNSIFMSFENESVFRLHGRYPPWISSNRKHFYHQDTDCLRKLRMRRETSPTTVWDSGTRNTVSNSSSVYKSILVLCYFLFRDGKLSKTVWHTFFNQSWFWGKTELSAPFQNHELDRNPCPQRCGRHRASADPVPCDGSSSCASLWDPTRAHLSLSPVSLHTE